MTQLLDKFERVTDWKSSAKANCRNIYATPRELMFIFKNVFGVQVMDYNTGEDKVNFDFEVMYKGYIATIYDWKYYRQLDMDETISWNIGFQLDAPGYAAMEFRIDVETLLRNIDTLKKKFS